MMQKVVAIEERDWEGDETKSVVMISTKDTRKSGSVGQHFARVFRMPQVTDDDIRLHGAAVKFKVYVIKGTEYFEVPYHGKLQVKESQVADLSSSLLKFLDLRSRATCSRTTIHFIVL
jgi:hypothetical protein